MGKMEWLYRAVHYCIYHFRYSDVAGTVVCIDDCCVCVKHVFFFLYETDACQGNDTYIQSDDACV